MKIQGIFATSSPKDHYIFDYDKAFFMCFADVAIYTAVGSLLAIVAVMYDSGLWRDKGADGFLYIPTFHSICQRPMKSGYLQSIVAFILRLTVRQLFLLRNSISK